MEPAAASRRGSDRDQGQGPLGRQGEGRRPDRGDRHGAPLRRRAEGRDPARQPRRHGAQEDPVRAPGQGQELRPLPPALEAADRTRQVPDSSEKGATAAQAGASAKSKTFKLKFIDLDPGDSGPAAELFNDLLRKQHYFNTDQGRFGSHTERAVMAFRKVNGMARNFQATPEIFAQLAAGKGAFKPPTPAPGATPRSTSRSR